MKELMSVAILLATPGGLDPEDAAHMRKGLMKVLTERSWVGQNLLTPAQRERLVEATVKAFEAHPRKFTTREVDAYVDKWAFSFLGKREEVPRVLEQLIKDLPGTVRVLALPRLEPADLKKAERQRRELIDHAVRVFRREFPAFDGYPRLRECVLAYLEHDWEIRCETVAEGLRRWMDAYRDVGVSIRPRVWKDEGKGDYTMYEQKLKIEYRIRKLKKEHEDFEQGMAAAATGIELKKGKHRQRLCLLVGADVVLTLFEPIALVTDK